MSIAYHIQTALMDIAKSVRLTARLVTRAARGRAENPRTRYRSHGNGNFVGAIPKRNFEAGNNEKQRTASNSG